jgi:zinc transport system substrate-binding protein
MVKSCLLCGLLLSLLGCRPAPDQSSIPKPHRCRIYTTSYPLFYIAQRLCEDRADVLFPAPSREDPAFWQPSKDTVRQYQQADLILLNGADFEKWVSTTSLPLNSLVDTAAGFKDQWLSFPEVITHSHGPHGAHRHGNIDFNTWLDPLLAMRQADAVETALRQLSVRPEPELRQRGQQLGREFEALDRQLREISQELARQPLLASHPVYDYLAREYHWDLHSVHWEPDESVTATQWTDFDALRAQHPANLMLWEDEPLPEVRAELQKRAVRPVVFLTCGNRPASGDYLLAMTRNIGALRAALK